MLIVSCSTKFWAFSLAEQLEKENLLTGLYSTFSYKNNTFLRRFVKRIDKEEIPIEKIHTIVPLAILMKLYYNEYIWNELFDKWVANELKRRNDYKVFIGWSSMSLNSMNIVKKKNKITILERGSSHILFQDKILKEEYQKFNKPFQINKHVIKKELQEYENADFIAIPSTFVKNTFLEYGFDEQKLILNPYGAGTFFKKQERQNSGSKFRILYLGTLNIRKGLVYLFDALESLAIPRDDFEVWFIGYVHPELKATINNYKGYNWKFLGHIDHYELPKYLSECDIAVLPSVEEGFGMVIVQLLACGIPVIATVNSGALDVIKDGENGFLVPIRSSDSIKEKIEFVYNDIALLNKMKENASQSVIGNFSWDDYGFRYRKFLKTII